MSVVSILSTGALGLVIVLSILVVYNILSLLAPTGLKIATVGSAA